MSADPAPPHSGASTADLVTPTPYLPQPPGAWSLAALPSLTITDHGELYRVHVEVSYTLIDRLELYAAPFAGFAALENEDTNAVGLDIGARFDLIRNDDAAFYVDGSLGTIYTGADFGDLGDQFNFVEQLGVGLRWPLPGRLPFGAARSEIRAGARFVHISNAGIVANNANANGAVMHADFVLAF